MRILGVNGSRRRGSYNGTLLRLADELLAPRAELVLFAGLATMIGARVVESELAVSHAHELPADGPAPAEVRLRLAGMLDRLVEDVGITLEMAA